MYERVHSPTIRNNSTLQDKQIDFKLLLKFAMVSN